MLVNVRMPNLKIHVGIFRFSAIAISLLSLTACGFNTTPTQCGAISEKNGEPVARKAVMQFLRYAGKTHAPISGDGGTLDATKLERIGNADLLYDGRTTTDSNTYQFHLQWAPNAIFTGTVARNCSVTTNWSIK